MVIHNYHWRLGLADGEPQNDALETWLAQMRAIAMPTITLERDANAAPHRDASSHAGKFLAPYAHRVIEGGIGHNPPQAAPRAFRSGGRGRRTLTRHDVLQRLLGCQRPG